MKKSNVILTVVLAIISVCLLALWYFLGFNEIESPLDLVLSIIWWVIIVAGIALVVRAEKKRQAAVRTVFLADDKYFESEVGLRQIAPNSLPADLIAPVLAALTYDFSQEDAPDQDDPDQRVDWRYIIHTDTYKPERYNDDGTHETEKWEGEVVSVATGQTTPFQSRAELTALLV